MEESCTHSSSVYLTEEKEDEEEKQELRNLLTSPSRKLITHNFIYRQHEVRSLACRGHRRLCDDATASPAYDPDRWKMNKTKLLLQYLSLIHI